MDFPARIALMLLLLAAPAAAQESAARNLALDDAPPANNATPINNVLPDKPAPQGNFLTRPFYDKKIRLLAEVNGGAAVLDDVASRMVIERGGYEKNPFMRPFVHNSGTLAVESIGEVWLMAFVADRMKHSHYPLLRRTWWLPQTINISAKVTGGIYNSVLLAR